MPANELEALASEILKEAKLIRDTRFINEEYTKPSGDKGTRNVYSTVVIDKPWYRSIDAKNYDTIMREDSYVVEDIEALRRLRDVLKEYKTSGNTDRDEYKQLIGRVLDTSYMGRVQYRQPKPLLLIRNVMKKWPITQFLLRLLLHTRMMFLQLTRQLHEVLQGSPRIKLTRVTKLYISGKISIIPEPEERNKQLAERYSKQLKQVSGYSYNFRG